jgi:hypothetical protein
MNKLYLENNKIMDLNKNKEENQIFTKNKDTAGTSKLTAEAKTIIDNDNYDNVMINQN